VKENTTSGTRPGPEPVTHLRPVIHADRPVFVLPPVMTGGTNSATDTVTAKQHPLASRLVFKKYPALPMA
jgi:hypothetical protein